MANESKVSLEEALKFAGQRDPNQEEFLDAVKEVLESLKPLFDKDPKYLRVLPAICEPERIVQFRVPWMDDKGEIQINRGFRVQFNSAIGPYKGGLRFHPTVNQSIVKFLGFEQIFKNALTGLPLGGGKGGSDFNPKGRSDGEVLRFCQSFMTELHKYIGPNTDVPAGDIGVGGREIGFLYGQWKRLTSQSVGVLTGKGLNWGGSRIRPEATGYGIIYITDIALKDGGFSKDGIKGLSVAISGSGNVASFAVEKCLQLGAKVLTMSDSGGTVYEPNGFAWDQYKEIMNIKGNRRRIKQYMSGNTKSKNAVFAEKQQPWQLLPLKGVKFDVVVPCATQNEVSGQDAKNLVEKCGISFVSEGANMPSKPEAIEVYRGNTKFFIPAKAANAGGVAVSGLEMAQNSQQIQWDREEVDKKLYAIMTHIYNEMKQTAELYGMKGDFQFGANAAGFKKVADAMFEQGMAL